MKTLSKADDRAWRLLKILLAACLATPLLASASFIFPYTVPKIFAFRILVEVAAALYLYLALRYQEFRPQRTFLFWAVLAFLSISFFSAIFGADLYTSWWGNLERGMGVWSLTHFVVWFLMLAAIFKEKKDWQLLIKLSVVVSVIVACTALIQRFGGVGSLLPPTDRIFGLIGNAGLLGSYLLFNIFLSGYLFFELIGWKKWLFAIGLLLLAISLFLTGTRGAYLGLLAGGFTGLLLAIFFGGQKVKKYGVIFLVLLFALAASLFLFRPISFSDATAQSRLILWQDSWQAWQAGPLLGSGPENFEAAIGKYLSPRLAEVEVYATDRAHSFIFDYGATVGWLGLLGYLAMFGAAAGALWRARKTDLILFAVFTSLLAAYLAQNFFIFDSFVSYLMLFFVLGTINNVHHPELLAGGGGSLGFFKKLILLLVIGYSLFAIYSYNFKPLLAANLANQILSLSASEAVSAGPLLKDALALDTFASPEVAYQAAIDYVDKINQEAALAQNEGFYDIASAELMKIISRSPQQPRNYLALAWLDLYFSGSAPRRMNDAIGLGDKAKELSPNKKDAYLILVAGYALSGQNDKAQEIISQALAIDGKMGEEVKQYWESLR